MTAGNYSDPHNQSNELLLAGAFCPPPRSAFKRAAELKVNAVGASGRTCKTREGALENAALSRRIESKR